MRPSARALDALLQCVGCDTQLADDSPAEVLGRARPVLERQNICQVADASVIQVPYAVVVAYFGPGSATGCLPPVAGPVVTGTLRARRMLRCSKLAW